MPITTSRPAARRVALASLIAVAGLLAACTATAAGTGSAVSSNPESPIHTVASPTLPTASASPSSSTGGAPVHISSLESDDATYGVGMPLVVYFNKRITSASAFVQAATVTVNGANAGGAWYFEASARAGEVVEAHYRPQNFWPGHAKIAVDLPMQGLSAGAGLAFDDSLTLNFSTGPANILTVNGATHELTVTTDGTLYGTFPVSLGATKTPTLLGTKVISEKDRNERMIGSGYNEVVPWSMRLTSSGEYLHAAAWNVANIGQRNTSNGCTNLLPADAEKLWNYLEVGDPVSYTNTGGTARTPSWDGYGDWNVSWAQWLTGGLLPTTG